MIRNKVANLKGWGHYNNINVVIILVIIVNNCNIGVSGGSVLKNTPANAGDQVQSLGWEGPLEKEMATHSSILAWKIPWIRSLAGYNP